MAKYGFKNFCKCAAFAAAALVTSTYLISSAHAFDGTPSAIQPTAVAPADAAKMGTKAYRAGNVKEAIDRWKHAAEGGHAGSQWRLARMFADGTGVPKDPKQAFFWFQQIVDSHADEEPGTPQGQIAGRAYAELGSYYLVGIPDSEVKEDPALAWQMFYRAASMFGDTDAQYRLGRLYLEGKGVDKNIRLGANWLKSAAEKGHHRAQGALGELLFAGEGIPRRSVEGLMWLSLARRGVTTADDQWIITSFEDAFTMATDDERMQAAAQVKRWQRQTAERE